MRRLLEIIRRLMRRPALHLASGLMLVALVGGCNLSNTVPPAPHVEPVVSGLRVLIVEETADRPRLPENQQSIFTSTRVLQFLRDRCAKDGDGLPAYRVFDRDADFDGEWADRVRTHPPKSYPWVYMTNGKSGYSGPLPASSDEYLSLLKTYAK